MFQIIPAIDLIDGKCVRLSKGDYDRKTIYNENPLDVAFEFEDHELKRLHLVDLDGAKAGSPKNLKVLEKIASKTSLIIDFGGGIATEENIESVFNAGASMASLGSIAVKNQALFHHWLKQYGSDKILLGADVKDKKIAISGWLENSGIDVFEFIAENEKAGVKTIFCTDISKDGMLQGISDKLYKEIKDKFPKINLIASGGVSSLDDVEKAIECGCSGIIIGKAIYEGRISLKELQAYNK